MATPSTNRQVQKLLTALAVMFGIIIGLIAGMLQTFNGGSMPSAIQYGCGAFAGAVLFAFGVISFWNGRTP